jgi:hypothetical protein
MDAASFFSFPFRVGLLPLVLPIGSAWQRTYAAPTCSTWTSATTAPFLFFSSFSLADLFNVPVLQLTLMNESSSIFTNNKAAAYPMVSTSDRAKTDEQQINFHQYACDLRLHLAD